MGKSRGDRYRPNHGQPHGPPGSVPQEVQPGNAGAYDSYIPDRFAQIRQGDYFDYHNQYRIDVYNAVDSWRSYRNDASNLQTATNAQSSFQSSYHGFVGSAPHQLYPPASAGLSAGSSAAQPYQARPSYYTPYQPLRVSDGTHERNIIQQAQNVFPRTQPQVTSRYHLRERRPVQLAPFSTAAARPQRSQWPSDVKPPPAPTATDEYKRQAALAPALRETPQKLLVILDLNGTLLVRPERHRPKHIIVRPGVSQLLDYLFQNHVVMVYSSAKPENCAAMVSQFFHPTQRSAMAGVWARDKLGLNKAQYNTKVQVYKKLEPIWEDKKIRKKAGPGQKWDQSNTILVDDSQLKGLRQPHNLLQIPEFLNNAPRKGGQELLTWQREQEQIVYSIQQKLEELKWQVDVSRIIREWQKGERQAPGVVDETVDQKALQGTQDRELSPTPSIGSPPPSVGGDESSISQQLQTPEASVLSDAEASDSYERDEGFAGGDTAAEPPSILDELEKEIDRRLKLDQNQSQAPDPSVGPATATAGVSALGIEDRDQQRSESPIDEGVWADILRGHGDAEHVDQSIQSIQKTAHARNQGSQEGKTQGQKPGAGKGKRQRKKKGPKEAKESGSMRDVPPTPESIDA